MTIEAPPSRIAFAAAALLAAFPAAATDFYFPALPVSVQFVPVSASAFCSSSELRDRIRPEFRSIGETSGALPADLALTCEPVDGGRVQFKLLDPSGKAIDQFKARVLSNPRTYDATAFLVARRLATGKRTIRAALSAYRADVRYSQAKLGSDDFAAQRWSDAANRLYRALESDAAAQPLYFGLYASHAKMGHAAQARCYLMMFCRATGTKPAKLTDRQIAYLREMPVHQPGEPLPGAVDLSTWRSLRDQRRWSGAIAELKDVIEQAPWAVEAYDALADSYKALGWTPLEDVWRERARLARKVAEDKTLQGNLLDALQAP